MEMGTDTRARKFGPPTPCVCCGVVGRIVARGLREACYSMWRRRDRLHAFPRLRHGSASYSLEKAGVVRRAEAYRLLTTGPGRLNRTRACIVLGINVRTAYRYEAWIREQEASESGGSMEHSGSLG